MKIQAITLIAVLSVAFASDFADAGQHPSFGGGNNGSNPGKGGRNSGSHQNWKPGYVGGNSGSHHNWKPGYVGGNSGSHHNWKPADGRGNSWVKPPVCHTPVGTPPAPVCHTPVWTPQPPVCPTLPVVSSLTLVNNSGQTFDYRLNRTEVDNMVINGQKKYDTTVPQGASLQPVTIEFHNGRQVVDFQLDPTATYIFSTDAQTQTLALNRY